jgi:hypothetical protein
MMCLNIFNRVQQCQGARRRNNPDRYSPSASADSEGTTMSEADFEWEKIIDFRKTKGGQVRVEWKSSGDDGKWSGPV